MRPTLTTLAILAAVAPAARAATFSEPADYGPPSVGTNLSNLNFSSGYTNPSNNSPWTDTGSTSGGVTLSPQLTGTSLSFPNLPPSPGGAISVTSAGLTRSPRVAISPLSYNAPGTTLYYSFLFNLSDITNLTTTGSFLAGFNNGTLSSGVNQNRTAARFSVRLDPLDPARFQVGISHNNNVAVNSAVTWDESQSFSPGQTLFIVGANAINGAGTDGSDDAHYLWVNPNPSTFGAPTPPAPTVTQTGGDITTGIASLILVNGGGASSGRPDAFSFDDLRVSTAWSEVAPHAGTNWPGGAGPWNPSLPSAPGAFINFNPGPPGAVDTGPGGQTAGTLNFRSANPVTILGGPLTLDPGSPAGTSSLNVFPEMADTPANSPLPVTHTIASPLTLAGANTNLNVGRNQTLLLSSSVSGNSALTKTGAGVVILSGDNTPLTGPVVIANGSLAITSDASLGAPPASPATDVTLAGGFLRFDAPFALNPDRTLFLTPPPISTQSPGGIDTNGNDVTLDSLISTTLTGPGPGSYTAGARLTKRGDGTLTLTNPANSFLGILIQSGTLGVPLTGGPDNPVLGALPAPNAAPITIQGPGTLRFDSDGILHVNRNIQVTSNAIGGARIDTNGHDVTILGPLSSSFGPNKLGPGTLTLANSSNTYSGNTTISEGTLAVPSPGSLGNNGPSNGIVINGGTLLTTSTFSTNRAFTVNPPGGTLDADGNTLTLDRSSSGVGLAINGTLTVRNGTLTHAQTNGTVIAAAAGQLVVDPDGIVRLASAVPLPAHTPIQNNGTLVAQSTGQVAGPVTGAGTTVVEPGASLSVGSLSQASLEIKADASVVIRNDDNIPSTLGNITLSENEADLSFLGSMYFFGVPPEVLRDLVKENKLRSAEADPNDTRSVGYAPVPGTPAPGTPRVSQDAAANAVATNVILVRNTLTGDANLNGLLDPDDYALLDKGFAAGGTLWWEGDFNYDGAVTAADYLLLDTTLGKQQGGHLSPSLLAQRESQFGAPYVAQLLTAVPEPSTLACLFATFPMLHRRRRRTV